MTTPIDLATSPLGISVLPHATKTTECSVRQHATDRARYKKLVRGAAEDPFAQSTVPIAAGHDQIGALIPNETQEFGGDRSPCLPPDVVHRSDSMAEKVACGVGKSPFGIGFRFAFADSDEQNLFGPLQKRKCITYGAAALTRVFQRHHHAAELQRSDGVGHYQHGPARPYQDHAEISKVLHVTPSMPCSDDDEIRRSGLARHELIRQFKRGAPFNPFEMLALGAELLAHVLETCARRAALMFRGLAIDDDTPRGKSRPQRQASDANERCLKAVGQSKSKLHSLFTVALDIEVDHHSYERHRFQLAAIKKRTDRTFRLGGGHRSHERCSKPIPLLNGDMPEEAES